MVLNFKKSSKFERPEAHYADPTRSDSELAKQLYGAQRLERMRQPKGINLILHKNEWYLK